MRKKIRWIIFIVVLILIILFITKFYLFFQFLFTKDLVIKLTSDRENIFTNANKKEEVNFKIYILTSPFCGAQCDYEFKDLSNNKLIDSNSLKLKSTIPITKKYFISNDIKTGEKLYSFNINCENIKTNLCNLNPELKTKTQLIILNYNLTSEEESIKENSQEKIIELIKKSNYYSDFLFKYDYLFEKFNIKTDKFKQEVIKFKEHNDYLKNLYDNQDYLSLQDELSKNLEIENNFNELNNNLYDNLTDYNLLIDNFTETKKNLEDLKQLNVSLNTSIEINKLVDEFDNLNINEKSLKNFNNKLENLQIEQGDYFSDFTLNISLEKIYLEEIPMQDVILDEPLPECCLFEKCDICYNNLNSPIIFLHGHDFNKDASAESSLDTFSYMQKNLEDFNHIKAGPILISNYNPDFKNILADFNATFMFGASYYFDLFKNTEEGVVIQTKTDNIDTYAIKLKDIIDAVKFKTGKDKVTLVAHSMGGLVVRRYLQVFGSGNIDKIILIGTPNKGIEDDTLKYCKIFGAELECNDMGKNSLFMSKLLNQKFDIPVYNIIGTGCNNGDGIVSKDSAYLENAENYFVNGTCDTLKLKILHIELPRNDEVIKIVKEILEK